MRVYLSCHDRDLANSVADSLKSSGHDVCSSWHRDPSEKPAPDAASEWADRAANNFAMIRTADVLVLIANPFKPFRHEVNGEQQYFGCVPGGKFYEAGFAHGFGKKVIVLGRVENGMLYHPAVKRCGTIEELVELLK